jgi:hypothetical protein
MADHYGTLAAALDYHQARGNQAWTAPGIDNEKRTAALVRASQALDALYGARYPGVVATASQDLLWPRDGVVWRCEALSNEIVPAPIEKAAYEFALRELVKPGSLAPDLAPGPQKVLTEVKGIKWDVVAGSSVTAVLPIVDGILAELLMPAPGGTSVTTLVRF